jgi:hypothetical protein
MGFLLNRNIIWKMSSQAKISRFLPRNGWGPPLTFKRLIILCFIAILIFGLCLLGFFFIFIASEYNKHENWKHSKYVVILINDTPLRVESIRLITWSEGKALGDKLPREKYWFEESTGVLEPGQTISRVLESGTIAEGTLWVQASYAGKKIEEPIFEYVTVGLKGTATVRFHGEGNVEVIWHDLRLSAKGS